MDINKTLQLASKHHQEGNLQQAEITYKEILKFDPYNIHILNYLGNVLQDQHKYDEVTKRIQDHADQWRNIAGMSDEQVGVRQKCERDC